MDPRPTAATRGARARVHGGPKPRRADARHSLLTARPTDGASARRDHRRRPDRRPPAPARWPRAGRVTRRSADRRARLSTKVCSIRCCARRAGRSWTRVMASDHLGRARARGYRADERSTLGLAAAAGAPAARAKRGRTGAERRATVTWRLCGHAGARMPAGARDGCGCGIAPTRLRGWLTSVFQPAVLDAYDSVRGAVSRWRWAPNTLRASGARAGPYAPRGGRKAAVWARRPPTTACVRLKLRREPSGSLNVG